MLIKTQDDMNLVNLDCTGIIEIIELEIDIDEDEYCAYRFEIIAKNRDWENEVWLGYYSSGIKASKVLDMISEAYITSSDRCKVAFTMPQDKEIE